MTIERFPTPLPAPFSKAVRAGGFLFCSGVLAMDAQANIIEGDVQVQTRAVLERLLDGLGSVARLAHEVEIPGPQQTGDAVTEEGVVIRQEDA